MRTEKIIFNSKKSIYFFCFAIIFCTGFILLNYFFLKEKYILILSLGVILYALWKMYYLRDFHLEISYHVFTVKYFHPIWGNSKSPYLELPIDKISGYKINKKNFRSHLIIYLKTRRGVRNQNFNFTSTSSQQLNLLTTALQFLEK